jgi:hypothetical protein
VLSVPARFRSPEFGSLFDVKQGGCFLVGLVFSLDGFLIMDYGVVTKYRKAIFAGLVFSLFRLRYPLLFHALNWSCKAAKQQLGGYAPPNPCAPPSASRFLIH